MAKYFGTDGIRGKANDLLSPSLALKVGEYLGYKFRNEKIIIGKDTRLSSDMLEHALAAGMAAAGADVYLLGTCATPALAYLIQEGGFEAGVMISASHNPYHDNGLKVFSGNGMKISVDLELEIESYLEGLRKIELAESGDIGQIFNYHQGLDLYIEHLEDVIQENFEGLRIVLDLAHGSAVSSGKRLFEDLGAEVIIMNDEPNGLNINLNCGSTHLESLQERVVNEKADMGFAFDGDADRCLAVDEDGSIVDGDKILYILGNYMLDNGELNHGTVVSTVMANLGFLKSMEKQGLNVIQTDVGDKNVFKEMVDGGYKLGGEQSGHIILSDYATTGDGVLTALKLAEIVAATKKSLKTLADSCLTFPQVLKNITVKDKDFVMNDKTVKMKVEKVKEILGENGRILVRPSGTEPLIRVMVEAESIDTCHTYVDEVIEHIKKL